MLLVEDGSVVEITVEAPVADRALANIEAAFSRGLPRFHRMPDLGSATGPVAIIGGGPSLADHLDRLLNTQMPLISCGTVHDYLIQSNIIPAYHVDAEPDADGVMLRWMQYPQKAIRYLLASQCPPSMFDALAGYDVWLWHCAMRNEGDTCFRDEPAIPGGCFSIARAWPIATIMGYRDIHFYGFDCSFPFGCVGQHAYPYDWTKDEVVSVNYSGERFLSTPLWLTQLQVFQNMVKQAQGRFKITVHGDSLAARVLR